ncbi:MAG: translocation/assembly module TamB domain-containing protein [Bacteroidota bacterium]
MCITAFTVLQLPYVQHRLMTRLLQHLSHTTQFTVTHQRFQVKWLSHVSITGLTIKDPQNHPMLSVEQLSFHINPLQLLLGKSTLKTLRIQGAQVQLRKATEEGYNLQLFWQRLPPATTDSWTIHHASLQDIEFSVDDQQRVPLQDVFDPYHFKGHQIQGEFANLHAQANHLAVDIRHFACQQVNGPLAINHLCTSLLLAADKLQCRALQLQTTHSRLQGACSLTYAPDGLLTAFYDRAHITASLDHAVMASEELAAFIPYFKQYKTVYRLSGAVEGKLNDWHLQDFQLGWGEQNSHLQGSLHLQGLPQLSTTVFDIDLQQGYLHTQDVLPYLDEKWHKLLASAAFVRPQGRIYGKYDDFTAQATFDTDLGKITTDLVFQPDAASQLHTYKGTLATHDFELGKWLNNSALQQLSMQGKIKGKGLSWSTTHFQLAVDIDKLGVNNYEYKNVHTDGAFAQSFFQGQVTVDDPNLKCQAEATINLSKDQESVAIEGNLEQAHLQALHLTDTQATLHTKLAVIFQGLSLDNSQLDAQLNEFCLSLAGRQVQVEAVHVHKSQEGGKNLLQIDSALVAFKAEGDFAYAQLGHDLHQFMRNFQRRLMHDKLILPKHTLRPYTLTYQVHCKDINPLLHVFRDDVYVAPGTQIQGSFSQGKAATFSLTLAEASAMAFKQYNWKDPQLTLLASQTQGGISAIAQLVASQQQWGALGTTKDFSLDVTWENDRVAFGNTLRQASSSNQLHLQGHAVLLKDTIELILSPASLQLLDHQWHLHPENRITIGRSWVQFQNFALVSEKQQVSLHGVWAADPSQVLHLEIKNVALDPWHLLGATPLTGVLNATAQLQGGLGQAHIDGDITVEQLAISHRLVGDMHITMGWGRALERLNLVGCLNYLAQQTVTIQGFYEPSKKEDSLQLVAHFSQTQLAAFQPLVRDQLSQLAGELTGMLSINGSIANPRITGKANIQNASLRINHLEALYQGQAALRFTEKAIHIDRLVLNDDQQGRAVLRGLLAHQALRDFQVKLSGKMTRFKLLDTAVEDNVYFYGTGILSGSLAFSGTPRNMAIHIKSKTAPGTRIFIPVNSARNTITQREFIHFVNAKTKQQASQANEVASQELQVTILLEITPDALTTLILDEAADDVIEGRGKGNLKIVFDDEVVPSITGGFEFSEGEYIFSFYPILNKTFKILPKSKITWTDSPYEGLLSVKAAYEQRVALTPLLKAVGTRKRTGMDRKYPVQVLVALRGTLLSPDVDFKINFLEYPRDRRYQIAISNFQKKAVEDKAYVTNQAVSLVIFKGFSEANPIVIGSDVVSRNLSELISWQLGNLVSGLDENLELDVDLEELSNIGFEGMRFKLARSFLDGKLRVSRAGRLGIDPAAARDTRILGDWTIEYFLTEDRRFRAKFYNKYGTDPIYTGTNKGVVAAGGVSLRYVRSFNQLYIPTLRQWWRLMWGGSNKNTARAAQAPKRY